MNNVNTSLWGKYYRILDNIVWALFDTTFNSEDEVYLPGKMVASVLMIIGLIFNTCLLILILNIFNIMHAPRTKYHEVMNQLDAYMLKKKFPMHLQLRLKYFFKKKFRKFYYREDEIMDILSGKALKSARKASNYVSIRLQSHSNAKFSSTPARFLSSVSNSSKTFQKVSSVKLP